MLNIVGPNYSDKPDCSVGEKLFERKNELRSAKTLVELDMEECLSRMNGIINGFDQNLYERIIESVKTYLKNSNQNLMVEKRRFNGENMRVR
jgi:uncharacterized protein YqgV (UPF0045/DUF77 family)